jgi:hypothetical protein
VLPRRHIVGSRRLADHQARCADQIRVPGERAFAMGLVRRNDGAGGGHAKLPLAIDAAQLGVQRQDAGVVQNHIVAGVATDADRRGPQQGHGAAVHALVDAQRARPGPHHQLGGGGAPDEPTEALRRVAHGVWVRRGCGRGGVHGVTAVGVITFGVSR